MGSRILHSHCLCPGIQLSGMVFRCQTSLLVFVLLGHSFAQQSLRGTAVAPSPSLPMHNSTDHRRTTSQDGVVNPVCVDYTIKGYFPSRGADLLTGLPPAFGEHSFVDRPATL